MNPYRAARLFGRAVAGAALLLIFAGASTAAFVFHLDLPAGRRLASRFTASLLNDLFLGSFEISGFSKFTANRFVTDEVRVMDPEGRVVLKVRNLRAELDAFELGRRLLSSEAKVTLAVPYVRIERAEAYIEPDANGSLNIARAFELRPEDEKEPSTSTSSRQIRVWLPNIELDQGFARGKVGDLPTLEAELTGARGQVLVTPVGVAVDVPRFATTWRGLAGADLRGIASFYLRGDRHVWTSFDGYFGDVQVDSVVKLDSGVLKIDVDLPRAEPEAVRALWPDWPVQAVASGHVEASGVTEHLTTSATLRVGRTVLEAKGITRLSGDVGVNLEVTGKDVDLSAVWPEMPETKLDGFTTLALWDSPQGVAAEVNAQTQPFEIAGVAVPALDLTGTLEEGRFEARAIAHERGLPLRVDFTAHPGGKLDLVATTRRFRLEKAPRIASFVAATGYADGKLVASLEEKQIEATLTADLEELRTKDLALARAEVVVQARGEIDRLDRLNLVTRVVGRDLNALGRNFASVKAEARGTPLRPTVTASLSSPDGPSVDAKAKVELDRGPRVSSLELAVKNDGTSVQASAGKVAIEKDRIEITDLDLSGAGTLKGSLAIRPGLVNVEARGHDVDLDVLSNLLGLPRGLIGGKLDVNAEVIVAEDIQRGRVELELVEGSLENVSGIGLELEASLEDERLDGTARTSLSGIARGTTQFNLKLDGSAADAKSYRRATGRTEIRLDEFDLAYLAPLFPDSARIDSLLGKLSGQTVISRDDPDALPAVTVLAGTSGLAVALTPEQKGEPPVVIQGIEAQLGARVDGPSGDVDATVRLLDESGSLATAALRTNLPIDELVKEPERLLPELSRATLLGKVVVDARPLETLPELIRPESMRGVLRADVTVGGSVTTPIVSANTSLANLVIGASRSAVPLDVCSRIDYSEETAELSVSGRAFLADERAPCHGQRVAILSSAGKLDLRAQGLESPGMPPQVFDGDVLLKLEGLPLQAIAPLGRAGIRGALHGELVLDQGGDRPQLNARLNVEKLSIDQIAVGDGALEVRSDGRALRGFARFEQRPGVISGEFNAALRWHGFTPELDRKSPLSLTARSDGVDAVILAPVLRDIFSELSGRIDGQVKLALEPSSNPAREPWQGDISGNLAMRGGSMQFQGLGMRLNDVTFSAETRTTGGRTVIELRNFSAASRARSPNVSASADVYLEGLELKRARANVNTKDVPILIEGVSQANATGRAFLDLTPSEDRMTVMISVPEVTAELPPSSGRNVISIDPNRSIEILQPISEPRRKKREQPKPWELIFALGDDVKVIRSDLSVPLTGRASIELTDETKIGGTLNLKPGGRVEYWGKTFVIEHGDIRFDTGDASNPHVNVTASWRAPEGTQIFVDITGTYREAKLRLRSDPERSDAEKFALLLGGTGSDDSGGSGNAAATGIGVGAGVLDRLLSDTPLRNVELRTASETHQQRTYSTYTAAVQLSDEIWFEGSYKAARQTETTDQNNAFSGTIDWRFKRNWSLRTEVGTIGTGLDLLWTYRY
jgi:hypothetical protein